MATRREFLQAGVFAGASSVLPATSGAMQTNPDVSKPNIVLIVSDQHRAGLTKRSGYPLDTSPTLDKLSDGGVSFEHAYCSSPLCVPSRTTMITGRWPDATRVRSNELTRQAVYPTHLYRITKDAGYRTGLAGKNHTFLTANDMDFWREYGLDDGYIPPKAPQSYHDFQKYMKSLHANIGMESTPFPVELQFPYRIVSDAIEFMEQSGDTPFFVQVGFSEPHDPEQVPAPYWNMFPPESIPNRCAGPDTLKKLGYRAQWEYGHQESGSHAEENWRRYKSNYLGMLRLLDDQVARLLDFMRVKGLLKNTIVIFTADHGDYLMDYGLARKGVGLPECLTRIPMIWSGPGIKQSHVGESAFVSNVDLLPTLCEAIGVDIPHGVQGRSLWPLLRGEAYSSDEFRSIYSTAGVGGLYYEASDSVPFYLPDGFRARPEARANPRHAGFDELNKVTISGLQKMVRMGDWKLIFDMLGYGQLYHLPSDPCELNNLFGKPEAAEHQARLIAELAIWSIREQDELPTGDINTKYRTKWPARHNWYAPYRRIKTPGPFIP